MALASRALVCSTCRRIRHRRHRSYRKAIGHGQRGGHMTICQSNDACVTRNRYIGPMERSVSGEFMKLNMNDSQPLQALIAGFKLQSLQNGAWVVGK